MPTAKRLEIGLTGGIGSGKSVVARIFALLDVPVYESDTEAKLLYYVPEIRESVIALIGEKAYKNPSEIDSHWIAGQIYANPTLREKLNHIIHPAVNTHYKAWVELQTHPYVLKVAALLFEADIYKSLDKTLLVVAPLSVRKERIAVRDPFRSKEQIEKIFASQLSEEAKIALADGLIYNDEQHSLIKQVQTWDEKIREWVLV